MSVNKLYWCHHGLIVEHCAIAAIVLESKWSRHVCTEGPVAPIAWVCTAHQGRTSVLDCNSPVTIKVSIPTRCSHDGLTHVGTACSCAVVCVPWCMAAQPMNGSSWVRSHAAETEPVCAGAWLQVGVCILLYFSIAGVAFWDAYLSGGDDLSEWIK